MQSVHRLKLHYGRKADDAGQGAIDVTEAEATWRTAPSTLVINTLDKLIALVLGFEIYREEIPAKAIISIAGAAAWLEKHLRENGYAPDESNLVLGTFPPEFVREVQGEFGELLFLSEGSGFEQCPAEVFSKDSEGALAIKPAGSMLPFPSFRKRAK
ncbi:uncharacterized protein BDW43DRAFT_309551 [Aspergillus alliaceus]|uniref:uncharacterized protein n=1 Tax=Petromyces alliaceus TaxID=209559 RepID=UPI0012A5564E|nr:uncharacterized protein BDW43DRAFT_309551 [Aspergillus alliaceus]KAB8235178.1 hypothetical protein BDW43DRAFT_309551 [Aspergillus alliaceus]